jgi:hypothetical protein
MSGCVDPSWSVTIPRQGVKRVTASAARQLDPFNGAQTLKESFRAKVDRPTEPLDRNK